MMSGTLLDRSPGWIAGGAPEGGEVVLALATLVRNLADYPFPGRCTTDERHAAVDRTVHALEQTGLTSGGRYFALDEFDAHELRFLVERRLITRDLFTAPNPKGAFIAEDQALSIMVNGNDHLCLRVQCAGLQLQEAWSRLNLIDDALASTVDFAFNPARGYLTSDLAHVGTGLKLALWLHLPALASVGELVQQADRLQRQHVDLHGIKAGAGGASEAPVRPAGPLVTGVRGESRVNQSLCSDVEGACGGGLHEALGDLYLLSNACTLGISEEESLFNVRHSALELVAAERNARNRMMETGALGVEDRVGRALGIATSARLISFTEGITLLSSLRLGVALGLLPGIAYEVLNELLLSTQGAHLERTLGEQVDTMSLNQARADLFRTALTS
jgi:protein arginine kinase